ncbi:hypothetical protein OG883_39610 [Streptomyces sp. NBC_01142]|uniref:hypothetical protein n=1 Tax=Streptomyces sp. NBC_01142 TaxID=2975865 RepID=UPI0022585B0C|nr:hypothetical protein [Streptomyces sp. NBC_01142]MCX4825826.1 hypothetical protein [Streptomyces sp. NBC_01142]
MHPLSRSGDLPSIFPLNGERFQLPTTARTGVEPAPRTGAEALTRAVQDGGSATVPPNSPQTCATVSRTWSRTPRRCPPTPWDTLVTALAGCRHPAWYTLYRCWREVETHHADLSFGYGTADWPTAYVTWALERHP